MAMPRQTHNLFIRLTSDLFAKVSILFYLGN